MKNIKDITFSITTEGMLEAESTYVNDKEKQEIADITSRVSERWQFEILGIVAEVLGYTVTIRQNGNELLLEAEEEGKSHPCKYIKVTKKGSTSALVFEHFASRDAIQIETAKFLSLAHRLGVKIVVHDSTVSEGDPVPGEHQHGHAHKDHESEEGK